MSESKLQWADYNGTWIRSGDSRKVLEAGFYEPEQTAAGWGLSAKQPVADELIDLEGTVADEVFSDIDLFMSGKENYGAFGLTHKRGYLFYGPPGSGKTSLGLMVARRFVARLGGVVMYTNSTSAFYHGVELIRDVEPGRPSMYLIEEADEIVNNSACLSILDGEQSLNGAVFVAMTNYKERMPPRIANRPGRFDRVMFVDHPPEAVQVEYLRRICARSPLLVDDASAPEKIVQALQGLPMSMAHLREAFISVVLMRVPLQDVRLRFEVMAGRRDDKGIPIEPSIIEHSDDDEPLVVDDWNPSDDC